MAETNSVQTIIQELGKVYSADLTWLSKQIEEVIAWKKAAVSPEELAQADIAFEILTKDIPATIKAFNSEVEKSQQLEQILSFGLTLAKAALTMAV